MYKWNDFLTKLAQTRQVSQDHKNFIKRVFLDIVKAKYSNMTPSDVKILLSNQSSEDNSKNTLFILMGQENRVSSTLIHEIEDLLNNYMLKDKNLTYIFDKTTMPFTIDIPKEQLPLTGNASTQRKIRDSI